MWSLYIFTSLNCIDLMFIFSNGFLFGILFVIMFRTAFAYEGWQLFICVLLSLGGNLVYPSLTSLVSGAVSPDQVGEALGAINGVKAMTGMCHNLSLKRNRSPKSIFL